MTDLSQIISGPPEGLRAIVFPMPEPGGYRNIPFGDSELPSSFVIEVWPNPEPKDEADRWRLSLAFAVIEGANNSEMRNIDSATHDVAALLKRVQRDWSLSTWKAWAHTILLLGELTPHRVTDEKLGRALSTVAGARPRPRRKTSVTQSHLESVVEVYRSAPQKPTLAVQKHFQTSHSTAARWVGLARKAGLLPPVE